MSGRLVILDMDGTLADTSTPIIDCYRATAVMLGLPVPETDVLRHALSGSLRNNLARVFDLRGADLDEALIVYRRYYISHGEKAIGPFDGVIEAIRQLSSEGYQLAVATMRLEYLAEEMLERWGVREMFGPVCGADLDDLKPKADMIRRCLEGTGCYVSDALMIGDSPDDFNAAMQCGMPFIAASYGYSLPAALCEDRGIPHVDSPSEIPGAVRMEFGL
jgi:phosphoglycolate phosphatase